MALSNEIILRPRFQLDLEEGNQHILSAFEDAQKSQSEFIITRVDDHVFIKIPKTQQHFWSPQLHLEIMETEEGGTKLFGLFGPNPTVWTMFMFFHFIVAGLFIASGIWVYTNWSLGDDFTIPLFVCLLMIVIWIGLYLGGRIGRAAGKDQMHELHRFMKNTLNI